LDGQHWKSKDPAKKPQVTQDMLRFLDGAQQISMVLFANGKPSLQFAIRPRLDPRFGDTLLEFEVDGLTHLFDTHLQFAFTWPAADTKKAGAKARLKSGEVSHSFAIRQGVWGIFRLLSIETREAGSKTVTWRANDAGDPIQPTPVQVELTGLPGDVDVFNPTFWRVRCPAKAVE
jgi:type VI protein secretion system component VasK